MQSSQELEAGARPRILVVEDEESVRHVLRTFLEKKGCAVHAAGSAEDARPLLSAQPFPDVALVDIVLPGKSGLDLLGTIRRTCPGTEVILMTSYGSVDTAIKAIRKGAYDYLQKPFESLDHVWKTTQRALDKKRFSATPHVSPADPADEATPDEEPAAVPGWVRRP